MLALGAVQLGVVASTPLPQFYKGTDNAPGGLAWTQEKGAEIITDRQGRVKSTGSNKGAQLTKLDKGDEVYTAEQTRQILFNKQLDAMLYGNGIASFAPTFSLPEFKNSGVSIDYNRMGQTFIDSFRAMPEGDSTIIIEDKLGKQIFKEKQGQRIELTNNRNYIKTTVKILDNNITVWNTDSEEYSLNDLVLNWEEGQVSFIEALFKKSIIEVEDITEVIDSYVIYFRTTWVNLPTSQRLDYLFTTFQHLCQEKS